MMESPEITFSESDVSHHISISKGMQTDDSGYVTVTPCSAESTAISANLTGSSSFSRSLNSGRAEPYKNVRSLGLCTPEEPVLSRKSRINRAKPKILSRDSFLDSHLPSDRFHESFENKEFQQTITTITIAPGRNSLKRQNAISEDVFWGNQDIPQTSCILDQDPCINQLESLVVSEEETGNFLKKDSDRRNYYRDSAMKTSSSDPSDYSTSTRLASSNIHFQPQNSDKLIIDTSNGHYTAALCDTQVPYPYTPVKYRKKPRRHSPDQSSLDGSTTPEKKDDRCSPIFKTECHLPGRKSVKRLNFNMQKIGTPEKNQILYPQLKPVTPPKKIKTPEKLKRSLSKSGNLKSRKSLQMKRQNFCGRDHIDFLKMLGEKQSHWPAIKCILSKLTCDDLVNLCHVSKTWRQVCQSEPEAEKRRRRTVQQKERMKENLVVMKPAVTAKNVDGLPHSINTVRRDLTEIQNHSNVMPMKCPPKPRSPPISPGKRRFIEFMKAASEDSTSQLRSCPRCSRPARVRDQWAVCGGRDCGYSFCARCLSERTPSRPCLACQKPIEAPSPSKQMQPKAYIGTKQSRRNLRRL